MITRLRWLLAGLLLLPVPGGAAGPLLGAAGSADFTFTVTSDGSPVSSCSSSGLYAAVVDLVSGRATIDGIHTPPARAALASGAGACPDLAWSDRYAPGECRGSANGPVTCRGPGFYLCPGKPSSSLTIAPDGRLSYRYTCELAYPYGSAYAVAVAGSLDRF